MRPLFDFGLSQEDPLTEFRLLEIPPGAALLCVASGGEIPLTLACLQPEARITAVDISPEQLFLARFKLRAALFLSFPQNGAFLGFRHMEDAERERLYRTVIRNQLDTEEQLFWDGRLPAIKKGVIHTGRFEIYLGRLRRITRIIIGKKNLLHLLHAQTREEQEEIFDRYIARRKRVKALFAIAFHPLMYKKRGLRPAALQHAGAHTGQLFFSKFRSFCTATPAAENYFFRYFLADDISLPPAFPEYLQEQYLPALKKAAERIQWKNCSIEEELMSRPPGTYQRIHLSNIGDWTDETGFLKLMNSLQKACTGGEKILYRYLQKNHFTGLDPQKYPFELQTAEAEKTDRFPFYSLLLIRYHGR